MKKLMASDCFFGIKKDYEITKAKAKEKYMQEEGNVFSVALEKYIKDNFSEKEILNMQDAIITFLTAKINPLLDEKKSFKLLLEIIYEINKLNRLSSNNRNTLNNLLDLYVKLYNKYGYFINSEIEYPVYDERENSFWYFNPLLGKDYERDKKLDSVGKVSAKNGNCYDIYYGLFANAYYIKDKELMDRIMTQLVVPSLLNNNEPSELIESEETRKYGEELYTEVMKSGYHVFDRIQYKQTSLEYNKIYVLIKQFISKFNLDYNLDELIHGDNVNKLMASMCFPIYQKVDYELTKEKVKELFSSFRKFDGYRDYYTEKFYKYVYENFTKAEIISMNETYIQKVLNNWDNYDNWTKSRICNYYIENKELINKLYNTLSKYNCLESYLIRHYKKDNNHEYINKALYYEDFYEKDSNVNINGTYEYYTIGLLPTLFKSNCKEIIEEILNEYVLPQYKKDKNYNYYVKEYYKQHGYSEYFK